jgi:hypothetical protein
MIAFIKCVKEMIKNYHALSDVNFSFKRALLSTPSYPPPSTIYNPINIFFEHKNDHSIN